MHLFQGQNILGAALIASDCLVGPGSDGMFRRRRRDAPRGRRASFYADVSGATDMGTWYHHPTAQLRQQKGNIMSADSDKAKGRVKQAVGDLTDDKDLKHEGKADEIGGKVKDAVDTVKDKLTGKDK